MIKLLHITTFLFLIKANIKAQNNQEISLNNTIIYGTNIIKNKDFNLFSNQPLSKISTQENNFGSLFLNTNLNYKLKNKVILGIGYTNFGNLNINKDGLELLLNGNYNLLNKKVSVKNAFFNTAKYSYLTIGKEFIDKKNNFKISTSISLAMLHSFSKINVKELKLSSDSFATFLKGNLNYTYYQSYTNKVNGLGAFINIDLTKNIKNDNLIKTIQLTINNVGILKSNKNTVLYTKNNVFNFQGISIDNLLFNKDTSSLNNITDSIRNIFYTKTNKATYITLPFNICNIINTPMYLKHYYIELGLNYIHLSNYKALFYIAPFFSSKFLDAAPIISYGGYHTFALGAQLRKEYKQMSYNLVINNMISSFSKNKNINQQVIFNLTFKF